MACSRRGGDVCRKQAANPTRVDLPGEHHLAADGRDFLADLAFAGKAPNTLRTYRGDLAELAQHHSGGVDQADVEALPGYFAAIGDLATSTRATELTKDGVSPDRGEDSDTTR